MAGIFKAYDIRAIYGTELDEAMAYKVGRAYATLMQTENNSINLNIAVGMDMRESSISLKKELIRGLTNQGVNVIEIGLVSTPSFYFGVANYDYDGGVMVSASHNPAEYNGFKMVRKNAIPIGQGFGMEEIEELATKNDFQDNEKGQISENPNVIKDQTEHDFKFSDITKIKPLKIVVDTANGMGPTFLDPMFERLNCEIIRINWDLDGNFPNHEANPLHDENNKQLQEKVIETGADLGITTDGDGDRIFFIDDKGVTMPPHILRGFLAKIFLRDKPGATICYDIRPGKITLDMIEEAGGKPIVTKVGHSLIKAKMREVDAYYGGESSGHFFLKLNKGTYEVPTIVALKMLEEISQSGKKFSEMIEPYNKYHHSGEINSSVNNKKAKMKELVEKYKETAKDINKIDGITIDMGDFWFNVRPSNTENKLRLNLEAISDEVMKKAKDEVLAIIRG